MLLRNALGAGLSRLLSVGVLAFGELSQATL